MTTTTRTFQKGDTVYTHSHWSDRWNGPFTVTRTRAASAREYDDTQHVWLSNGDHKRADRVYHVDELTPAQVAAISEQKAQEARDRHAAASRKARIKAAETAFLAANAEALSAPPVWGPVTIAPRDGEASVGATCSYWRVRGEGSQMELYTRQDWYGVSIRRQYEYDREEGKHSYRWGISFGGTTYTPEQAAVMAESIRVAIAHLPEMGDPRPSYDND